MEKFIYCYSSQKLWKFNSFKAPPILTLLFIKGCTNFVFLVVLAYLWFLVRPSVDVIVRSHDVTISTKNIKWNSYRTDWTPWLNLLKSGSSALWNVCTSTKHKSRLIGGVSTSHTFINIRKGSSERVISSSQRSLTTQHPINTQDEYPCTQRDSNPRLQ